MPHKKNASLQLEIKEKFPEILFNEPLKKYSSIGVGGPADFFYRLADLKDLPKLVKFAKKKRIPYVIIGGASNILFSDKGFRGLVIKIQARNITVEKKEITAESGASIFELVEKALQHNYNGLERWFGLPGTVGGAVRGNAGCNGLETKDILTHAVLFNPKTGRRKTVKNSYFGYGYRDSKLKHNHEIVLSATFKLQREADSAHVQTRIIDEITKLRLKKQPFGLSCGSFFKNPSPTTYAGELIERAGLKGKSIGKAQISEKHGNFILNLGGATASDILKLVKLAKRQVKAKLGVSIQEEVQIMSETGPAKL